MNSKISPDPIRVRAERDADREPIRRLNVAAFPTPAESLLVDRLREGGKLALSLVAEQDGEILGHIAFSAVALSSGGAPLRGFGIGPMAVRPARQKHGIGTLLVHEGLARCRAAGLDYVVVLGHPRYYPRFGFEPASRFALRCAWPVPDGVFMAMELRHGALDGRSGLVEYEAEFNQV
ncbi:MAG: GNAT family N-acetyltransferase [Bacteroidales bacterium]